VFVKTPATADRAPLGLPAVKDVLRDAVLR
jgi:hypothetical protein